MVQDTSLSINKDDPWWTFLHRYTLNKIRFCKVFFLWYPGLIFTFQANSPLSNYSPELVLYFILQQVLSKLLRLVSNSFRAHSLTLELETILCQAPEQLGCQACPILSGFATVCFHQSMLCSVSEISMEISQCWCSILKRWTYTHHISNQFSSSVTCHVVKWISIGLNEINLKFLS